MDLFATAGLELPHAGKGGARARKLTARSLRTPLFAYKVVEEARRRAGFAPTQEQLAVAKEYARKARKRFGKKTEEAIRPIFFFEVLQQILGYKAADPEAPYTLAYERPIRRGKVDVALGRFEGGDGRDEIIAPFELKGPTTVDLDAPMPGRGRSPVQQAWDYAMDAPGARFVLVSNCLEIRLYGFGRGRDAYELFDLTRLDEEEEHARLWLILSAARFLGGVPDALLVETDNAYKDVTNRLYQDYKGLRERLIQFMVDSADGPRLANLMAIETAQKILDRILFIAFAQRTDLLPERLLERAVKATSEFDPQPIWSNFRGLFRMVDRGHYDKAIPAYNGGLFAADPMVDALMLPDPLATDVAALGEWDYRHEVPVTVLGHIFEQSITDIERMKAESRGEAPPAASKRKREGVVYTPDMVTRFLVEKTIGLTLRERFDEAWARHGLAEDVEPQRAGQSGEGFPHPEAPAKPASKDEEILRRELPPRPRPSRLAALAPQDEGEEGRGHSPDHQRAFWREHLAMLRGFTIVDPACGSGAFLIAAFDALAAEYTRAEAALTVLGETIDFDIFDEIVTKNLYGVDLNAESVEITRLSLWLKTARRDHRLQNLENAIRIGDSLIEDGAFTARPFDWRAAFPRVFEKGGFDVVIGNPPYVRMEFIKAVKPYLEKHYVVAADRADLYAYFFERGVWLLKDGGRLGFISSSTFFRTGSGENLRKFLTDGVRIENVVDFGDTQIFEGVTTYPAILSLRKGMACEDGSEVSFFVVGDELPKDLNAAFDEGARKMPRARLGAGSWRFEDEPLARLRDKILEGRKTLGEVYGAPLRGIVTGLNEAFVIDTPTRDRLVRADKKSAELLEPFLRGEDVKRWRVEPEGLWLINTPKGKVKIDNYPAIRGWLAPFKKELEQRATKQEWWELQQAQLAYQPALGNPKLVWSHFQIEPSFCLVSNGLFLNNKCFFIPSADSVLCCLLNSRLYWAQLTSFARVKRGGYIEAEAQYVEQLPIPKIPAAKRARLKALGEACTKAAREKFEIQSAVRRRIFDLAPPERAKLTGKLEQWQNLDFAAFRAEVKRAFRVDIKVKERGEWEAYLSDNGARVRALTDEIASAEREIDAIVYSLFELTPEEIALLESSLGGQY